MCIYIIYVCLYPRFAVRTKTYIYKSPDVHIPHMKWYENHRRINEGRSSREECSDSLAEI